ncbi:MAG: sulfurtransferase [Burkholderiaceae bacterium]
MNREYSNPQAIVSAHWLADHLDDAGLRIFDCTVYLRADTLESAYRVVSGREDYNSGHIPGAAFLDLQDDLSDSSASLRFTMPPPDELMAMFASHGVGDGSRIVLYSRDNIQWATRVWWMLRAIGFDNAAILDGGWEYWTQLGLPVSTDPSRYPATSLSTKPRAGLFVGKQAVQAASADADSVVINALSAELHAGHSPRYGRPGRIPGSVNVPANSLRDDATRQLLPANETADAFERVGASADKKVLIYCGGGIAATLDAFVLYQLGYPDIAVYDNSLNEWARDESLPMESD